MPTLRALLLLPALVLPAFQSASPAVAEGLRTVVVPSGGGVVVAPRSAPPRLAARPAQARTVAVLPASPAAPPAAAPSAGSYALPALSLIPLAVAGALFATGGHGGGGGGTVAPARTQ